MLWSEFQLKWKFDKTRENNITCHDLYVKKRIPNLIVYFPLCATQIFYIRVHLTPGDKLELEKWKTKFSVLLIVNFRNDVTKTLVPLPFTSISPRSLTLYEGDNNSRVDCDMCICIAWLVASMRDAVFTESPNKQYRGIFKPTIPATTAPLWMPTRIWRWRPETDSSIKYNHTKNKRQNDSKLFFAWKFTCGTIFKVRYRFDHIECHVTDTIRVIVLFHRSTGHHHVRVSDSFNLTNV